MEEVDLLLKNALLVSIIFAILGISWQLMKLLSKTTETLEEFRHTNVKVNKLVDKVSTDYEYISSTIKSLSVTIDNLNKEVLNPIRSVGNVFHAFESVFQGVWSRVKTSTDAEDYLPEGEYEDL